ncbi:MAG: class I SAM-dependent methyltransferase [Candidatus Omnitrophota bacterium]
MKAHKKLSQSATFRILFSDDIVPPYIPLTYRFYLLFSKLRDSLFKRLTTRKRQTAVIFPAPAFASEVSLGEVSGPLVNKSIMSQDEDLATAASQTYAESLASLRRSLQDSGLRATNSAGNFKQKDFRPEPERRKLWENTFVLAHACPGPADTVLDLGGASTLFSFYLASLGCQTHVLDYDVGHYGLIYNARHVSRAMDWNMRVYNRDLARPLPFSRDTFDKVYCICVLEHLSPQVRRRTMGEIARVLKPGGMAALTFDFNAQRKDPWTDQGLRFGHKEALARDILEPSGLKIFGNEILKDDCPREFFLGALFLVKSAG